MAGFLSNPQMAGGLLQALAGTLLTAGAAPNQRSQVGLQAIGNFQNQMMDQRRQKERDLLLNIQLSENARANQEREEAKRKQQEQELAYKNLLGGQAPANGMSQAQFGGAPQTTGPLGNLNDAQRQFLQAAGPQAGLGIIGQELFKEPAGANSTIAKAGQDLMNGLIDKPTYDAIVKKETYIAPQQGPQAPADIQEYNFAVKQGFPGTFMDFKAAQKGQGMSVTLPDGTVMQVGGNSKPVTAADQATSLRATMLDDAINEFETIDFDKIRTPMIVAAEKSKDSPIMGSFVQTNLNEDEKKLLGNQGKIQEAVISAITGAAYTEEQKQNMRAAYVPLATDEVGDRLRKLQDAAKFLKQMNKGVNRGNQYTDTPDVETIEFVRDPATGQLVPKAR